MSVADTVFGSVPVIEDCEIDRVVVSHVTGRFWPDIDILHARDGRRRSSRWATAERRSCPASTATSS